MAAALQRPSLEVERIKSTWHLAFNFGALQPVRTLSPAIRFFVRVKRSKTIALTGRVLAENIATLTECRLSLKFSATTKTMTLDELEVAYAKVLEAGD